MKQTLEQASGDRPEPHAPPFADLREARAALRRQMFVLDGPLGELRRVAKTVEALSLAAIVTSPETFHYLSRRLDEAVDDLEAWSKRARATSLIACDDDLDAFSGSLMFKDKLAETHEPPRDEP